LGHEAGQRREGTVARKMIVLREDGSWPVLSEVPADNEEQLRQLMKDNPELLPVDEFGLTGPLMIVGRDTTLPSGAADLVGIARGGEILVIEFKTGPHNADFRHVLAQLLDYGSDLWRMTYEEFESTVARRYFSSDQCADERLRAKASLDEASRARWPDLSEEEIALFRDRVLQQLTDGSFHYVVVAQRFTPTMERTLDYLNSVGSSARFYALEMVRFAASGLSAFESRTVLKPQPRTSGSSDRSAETLTNEAQFLNRVEDESYREALEELLDVVGGLGLYVEWGSKGSSIRVKTPDRPDPLSIGWLFPPDVAGWNGLRDLSLGFDPSSAKNTPSVMPALEEYLAKVAALPAAEPVKTQSLRAYHLTADGTIRSRPAITEILAQLVKRVGEAG